MVVARILRHHSAVARVVRHRLLELLRVKLGPRLLVAPVHLLLHLHLVVEHKLVQHTLLLAQLGLRDVLNRLQLAHFALNLSLTRRYSLVHLLVIPLYRLGELLEGRSFVRPKIRMITALHHQRVLAFRNQLKPKHALLMLARLLRCRRRRAGSSP